jgi:hypothetical protein
MTIIGPGEAPDFEDSTAKPDTVDIGPYCVDCREDTTGQEGRTTSTSTAFTLTGDLDDEGEPEVKEVTLSGWLCENCQPFANAMIEATAQALIERRYDAKEVRRKLRQIGEEKIWEVWHGPLVDQIEVVLGLEPK